MYRKIHRSCEVCQNHFGMLHSILNSCYSIASAELKLEKSSQQFLHQVWPQSAFYFDKCTKNVRIEIFEFHLNILMFRQDGSFPEACLINYDKSQPKSQLILLLHFLK